MEDLVDICKLLGQFDEQLENETRVYMAKLRTILHGSAEKSATTMAPLPLTASSETIVSASPQQTKKRVKVLSLVNEIDETINLENKKSSNRSSNLSTKCEAMDVENEVLQSVEESVEIQLQPSASLDTQKVAAAVPTETHEFLRPQRAAKLKSEKNLKEPSLNKKLRRPSQADSSIVYARVKKENEQRQSQMLNASSATTHSKISSASVKSTDSSIVLLPEKASSVVDLISEAENEDETIPHVPSKKGGNEKKKSDASQDGVQNEVRQLRVKIKREKISLSEVETKNSEAANSNKVENNLQAPDTLPQPKIIAKTELVGTSASQSIIANATSSNSTASVTHSKKSKKQKKDVPVPIKVERFSDLDAKHSPIASRTRSGSSGHSQRQGSVYEDAVSDEQATQNTEQPRQNSQVSQIVKAPHITNQTMNVSTAMLSAGQPNTTMVISAGDSTFTTQTSSTANLAPQTILNIANGQTTFIVENPNLTVTNAHKEADATFNIAQEKHACMDNQSMVTAKDSSHTTNNSSATEDECYKSPQELLPPPLAPAPKPLAIKSSSSAKAYKMPTRTNELFNPLVQSPLKKKVEAFEAAAVQQLKSLRPKRTKENALPTPPINSTSSNTTPSIGKLPAVASALGRFLTPTQSSNVTPNATTSMQTKKLASSASKIMPFTKTMVSSLKATSSSSSSSSSKHTLSRENSDDFRRGLQQLAEERKKQREQKHLLAAQLREAKEKERTERMAKLAKEREEKRLKKQAELDQKKKALDEIQRKLKQNEEQEALKQALAKSKANQDQERELLKQMKPPKSKPLQPVPKPRTKYVFEMLHEDDSTDDEDKVTYKRPPPPSWSRSSVRGPAINMQQYCPTDVIDSFFSVQAMSPDLKMIFPNIDERYLKRNSSAYWTTPPRYSELPKY